MYVVVLFSLLSRVVSIAEFENKMERENSAEIQKVFEVELEKQVGIKSWWFVLFLVAINWPGFAFIMTASNFVGVLDREDIRCEIPELEESNWTFDQLKLLSHPSEQEHSHCVYYDLDYEALIKMDFEQAIKYKERVKNDTQLLVCQSFVSKPDAQTMEEEFKLACRLENFQINMVGFKLGRIIGGVFLCPWGDIYGRKRLMNWGVDLSLAGGVIRIIATRIEMLTLGSMLSYMGYVCLTVGIQSIIMEIFAPNRRRIVFLYSFLGESLGLLVCPLFADMQIHWRLIQCVVSWVLLFLPLIAWFVPESPRLFFVKRKRARARFLLQNIQNPADQEDLVYAIRNEKRNRKRELKNHWTNFRNCMRRPTNIAVTGLVFLSGWIVEDTLNRPASKVPEKYTAIYIVLTATVHLVSLLLDLIFMVIFERKVGMALAFLFSGISIFVASQFGYGTFGLFAANLAVQLFVHQMIFFVFLSVVDSAPTVVRCTVNGLLMGGLYGVPLMVTASLYFKANDTVLGIVNGCMALAGFLGTVLFVTDEYDEKVSLVVY